MRFIFILLIALMGARRVAFTLLIAVVLSSVEIERRRPATHPAPIVIVLKDPPGPRMRARPYRAHHRRTATAGW